MKTKRAIATIKQYDYTSFEEFQKDIPRMNKKGYALMENVLTHGKISFNSTWTYTAYFIKNDVM